MTRYMRWLADERGLEFGDYEALWRWSVDRDRGVLGLDLGLLRGRGLGALLRGPPRPRDAGRGLVSRRRPELCRSTSSATATTPTSPSATPRSCASSARSPGASSATRSAAPPRACASWASAAATASSPTCPTSPRRSSPFSRPRSIGAIWSSCSPDFGACERRRPLRADRAEGPVRASTATATAAGTSTAREVVAGLAGRDADPRAHGRPPLPRPRARPLEARPGDHAGTSCSRAGEGATLEFEQVPFDHPLWVLYSSGTTGLPKAIVQGHGGILLEQLKKLQPPRRRPGGRPPVLVHDDRLDDVELPRRRPAHPRLDRALRRQPRPPGHGRALGPRRATPA